ncbi:calphotin-like [Rhopalosiphum padi]|uniref:calphotin-like n=1 Tax=Rhopalosiphum padi TaxID=40932 RepID=UPI00298DEB59|nr:calphotin-like [Rhopalosiphum padi]
MNCVQICLMLATSCLMLVSANTGSYNYAYGVNDPITGDLKDQRETKVCNEQVYDENVLRTAQISREQLIPVAKNFVSEPIISTVSSAPVINTEYVSVTPSPILRTADFESSRILAATPILETKVEAEPLSYAPLPKYAAPVTVTAAPMLETRIAAEPLVYAPLPKFAPLPKYAPRPEYYAASPAPLVATKLQTPIVQYQAAPIKIIKSAKSYGRQSTSFSHRSFVNHPLTPAKIAAPVAPLYYSAAPAATEYYAPAPAAPEYYAPAPKAQVEYYAPAPAPKAQVEYYAPAPAPKAQVEYYAPAPAPKAQVEYYAPAPAPKAQVEYYAPAPAAKAQVEYYAPAPVAKAQEYYAPALTAPEYYLAAPKAQEYNSATIAQIAHPLQQATRTLYVAPTQYAAAAPYVYRSSSGPATSYQYANHWNNRDQSAAGQQSRYSVASPQQYSAGYQPQYDSASQSQNSGQYDAAQEQPCEK